MSRSEERRLTPRTAAEVGTAAGKSRITCFNDEKLCSQSAGPLSGAQQGHGLTSGGGPGGSAVSLAYIYNSCDSVAERLIMD